MMTLTGTLRFENEEMVLWPTRPREARQIRIRRRVERAREESRYSGGATAAVCRTASGRLFPKQRPQRSRRRRRMTPANGRRGRRCRWAP